MQLFLRVQEARETQNLVEFVSYWAFFFKYQIQLYIYICQLKGRANCRKCEVKDNPQNNLHAPPNLTVLWSNLVKTEFLFGPIQI